MTTGSYGMENLVIGKKYVGQGIDVHKRMNTYHYSSLALNNSIKKHGKENFKKYVLIYCEEYELDRLEIELIKKMNSHVSKNGYNILLGGHFGARGIKLSQETRNKMSISKRLMSEETKLKMSKSKKLMSEETKKKIGSYRTHAKRCCSSSKYFGVCWMKNKNIWRSQLTTNGKKVSVGQYKTELEAAIAYDTYVVSNGLSNPRNF